MEPESWRSNSALQNMFSNLENDFKSFQVPKIKGSDTATKDATPGYDEAFLGTPVLAEVAVDQCDSVAPTTTGRRPRRKAAQKAEQVKPPTHVCDASEQSDQVKALPSKTLPEANLSDGQAVVDFMKKLANEAEQRLPQQEEKEKRRGKKEESLRDKLHKSWNGLSYLERLEKAVDTETSGSTPSPAQAAATTYLSTRLYELTLTPGQATTSEAGISSSALPGSQLSIKAPVANSVIVAGTITKSKPDIVPKEEGGKGTNSVPAVSTRAPSNRKQAAIRTSGSRAPRMSMKPEPSVISPIRRVHRKSYLPREALTATDACEGTSPTARQYKQLQSQVETKAEEALHHQKRAVLLEQQIKDLQDQVSKLQVELAQKEKQGQKASKDAAVAKQAQEKKDQKASSELANLKKQNDTLLAENKHLKQTVQSLNRHKEQWRAKRMAMQTKLQRAQQVIADALQDNEFLNTGGVSEITSP